MFRESQGGCEPRAEQGAAWEEMRSLSESVFSRAGFILVNFSLSEMGSPCRVEKRRGRPCHVFSGWLASEWRTGSGRKGKSERSRETVYKGTVIIHVRGDVGLAQDHRGGMMRT